MAYRCFKPYLRFSKKPFLNLEHITEYDLRSERSHPDLPQNMDAQTMGLASLLGM